MPSPYKEIPITFEKGLVTEIEESLLDVGQASELLNWEPATNGALRSRNRWASISKSGLPSRYRVRGWGTAAIGSGGGAASSVIVQKNHTEGDFGATESISLTGVTPGNIMVGHVFDNGAMGTASGWTKRTSAGSGDGFFTKVATGSTETFTVSTGTQMFSLGIYELSGVASATPTAVYEDEGGGSAQIDFTAASAGGAGIAIIKTAATIGGAASPSPTSDGFTAYYENTFDGIAYRHYVYTKTYSASPVTASFDASGVNIFGSMILFDAGAAASTPADFYLLLAVATDTGYSIYRIVRNSVQAGTWELVDSATCSDTSAFVSMAVGTDTLVWSASTMTVPRAVVLSTLAASDVTDLTSKAGRAVVYHKDRMFVAGDTLIPSRLYFSDIGIPTDFTTATDFLDIGGDDGEAIEDLLSVEGLLLVCKTNRLYLVSGSGVESFFVNELPGGSAATGRAATRTPYGTIVAGPSDIWVVQGGGVDPMSRPLGADYSITGLVSTAYAQDAAIISDSATGNTWRVNLVTGAWSRESIASSENAVGHVFSLQGRLYYGVYDSVTEIGGTRRLSSDRSYDELTDGMAFVAATGKLALLGPSVKYTGRFLYMQLRNNDPDNENVLDIEIISDQGTVEEAVMVSQEIQRKSLSLGKHKGAEWIKIRFSDESSPTAGSIDVERMVLGVDTEAPRVSGDRG